jgi:hypothetical protein
MGINNDDVLIVIKWCYVIIQHLDTTVITPCI